MRRPISGNQADTVLTVNCSTGLWPDRTWRQSRYTEVRRLRKEDSIMPPEKDCPRARMTLGRFFKAPLTIRRRIAHHCDGKGHGQGLSAPVREGRRDRPRDDGQV